MDYVTEKLYETFRVMNPDDRLIYKIATACSRYGRAKRSFSDRVHTYCQHIFQSHNQPIPKPCQNLIDSWEMTFDCKMKSKIKAAGKHLPAWATGDMLIDLAESDEVDKKEIKNLFHSLRNLLRNGEFKVLRSDPGIFYLANKGFHTSIDYKDEIYDFGVVHTLFDIRSNSFRAFYDDETLAHPHIDSIDWMGNICLGSLYFRIKDLIEKGMIDSAFDAIQDLLGYYNPKDCYSKLTEDICPICGDGDCCDMCSDCRTEVCEHCLYCCDNCGTQICTQCDRYCSECEMGLCSECYDDHVLSCVDCGKNMCERSAGSCENCGEPICEKCVQYYENAEGSGDVCEYCYEKLMELEQVED